jgi:hypothetical protein
MLVAGLCAVLLSQTAGALTMDGDLSDWMPAGWDKNYMYTEVDPGKADPGYWTPAVPAIGTWEENHIKVNGKKDYVEPGYGGQDFDVEAGYLLVTDPGPAATHFNVYFAMVTGFDLEGEDSWLREYFAGDVFFDFCFDGTYGVDELDYAVRVDPTDSASGTVFDLSGAGDVDISNPHSWATALGYYRANANATIAGTATMGYTDGSIVNFGDDSENNPKHDSFYKSGGWNIAADHNILEFSFSVAKSAIPCVGGTMNIAAYWTMGCANDELRLQATNITPGPGPVPVPEPATMTLLGLGLAGMACAAARRQRR